MRKKHPYPLLKSAKYYSFAEFLDSITAKYKKRTAFTYTEAGTQKRISYLDFSHHVRSLANHLRENGYYRTKIAVFGENSYEWIISYLATILSENTIVPLDKDLSPAILAEQIAFSDATAFFYSVAYEEKAKQIQKDASNELQAFCLKDISKFFHVPLQTLSKDEMAFTSAPDAPATLVFTSGTTGRTKGVLLSQRNIMSDVCYSCHYVRFRGTSLVCLPLHHLFSLTASVLCILHDGGTLAINKRLTGLKKDIQEYRPRSIMLVPALAEGYYKQICNAIEELPQASALHKRIEICCKLRKIGIDARRYLLRYPRSVMGGKIDFVITGGAPMHTDCIRGLRELGIDVLNGYGITECSPVVSVNRIHDYQDGSVGRVLPCCDVKILNPNEDGEGEVAVRGPTVMLGYYKNDAATHEIMEDGWFRTGDLGVLKDGFLFIKGRVKNIIVLSNGKKIVPEELEEDLKDAIPRIQDVVVSAPNDILTAEMYFGDPPPTNDELPLNKQIADFNMTQPPYKNIEKIVIREIPFPKTSTQKIKR